MTRQPTLAMLVSGSGSLFESSYKQFAEAGLPIGIVIADRHCRGREIAAEAGIEAFQLPRSEYLENCIFNRGMYTRAMVEVLHDFNVDFVIMAGFMTIFADEMFASDAYGGRITNNHPSLLPDFKGHDAVRDALAAGVKETGFTIHFATPNLDDGPIIKQERVPILPGDTVETLHERIKIRERLALAPAIIPLVRALRETNT